MSTTELDGSEVVGYLEVQGRILWPGGKTQDFLSVTFRGQDTTTEGLGQPVVAEERDAEVTIPTIRLAVIEENILECH
ncbi:hypothetical protein, partial [Pseudomonas aeruginosa]|uniref:hypothetical protein n=1 Tax=Pseudomonas aeruginosa TaxID=287 RepID=UPI0024BD9B67